LLRLFRPKKLELDPKPNSWNSTTTEVWIKIVPDTYKQEIAAVLEEGRKGAKETRPPEDDAAINKLYDTWQKINNQADWHHVWPQWLGGAEIQTPTLYMPRWIHDFGRRGDRLEAVSFHRHLREIWYQSEFYKTYSQKGYKLSYESGPRFQEAFNGEAEKGIEARKNFIRLVKEVLLQAYKNAFEAAGGQETVNQISQLLDKEMKTVLNSNPQNKTGSN
jgi:hypothetical protein